LKIVSGQVPVEDVARLAALARSGDRTLSAEVRRAIREHVERAQQAEQRELR
jgi:predicted transcriptional regulator